MLHLVDAGIGHGGVCAGGGRGGRGGRGGAGSGGGALAGVVAVVPAVGGAEEEVVDGEIHWQVEVQAIAAFVAGEFVKEWKVSTSIPERLRRGGFARPRRICDGELCMEEDLGGPEGAARRNWEQSDFVSFFCSEEIGVRDAGRRMAGRNRDGGLSHQKIVHVLVFLVVGDKSDRQIR